MRDCMSWFFACRLEVLNRATRNSNSRVLESIKMKIFRTYSAGGDLRCDAKDIEKRDYWWYDKRMALGQHDAPIIFFKRNIWNLHILSKERNFYHHSPKRNELPRMWKLSEFFRFHLVHVMLLRCRTFRARTNIVPHTVRQACVGWGILCECIPNKFHSPWDTVRCLRRRSRLAPNFDFWFVSFT